MESIFEYIKSDGFLLISFMLNIIMILFVIINFFIIIKMHKRYISFMNKIGNGNNLDEMLKTYLKDVDEIKRDNSEIKAYYTKLDRDIASCIQKVGIIR